MALTYSQLQSITQEKIVPKMQDNIFDKTPILSRLKKRKKMQDGGEYIKQPLLYAKKTSKGVYSGFDTLLTAANPSVTAAAYNWSNYYCNMALAETDLLKNSGESQIISLLTTEAKSAEMTLADDLTTDLCNTSSVTGGIQGFPLMIESTTSTAYGGITPTDFTSWVGQESSTTTLTLGLLQSLWGDCTDGMESPTVIFTVQDNFDKIWQLYEVKPEFRVQNKNSTQGGMKFQGADIIVDNHVNGSGSGTEDNHLYMINENFIQFYCHPKDNMKVGKWQKPTNQEVRIARITWMGQLGTDQRRRHGKLDSVDPAL
jgi:hypothetical protein